MSITISEQTGQLIVKAGFGVILAFVAWTVVASFVFLFGTGLLHEFPQPFWQWWLYALNFDGNPRVALWLKIGAGAGAVPPGLMIAALVYRGQRVVGPKLRRPLFGGIVKSPLAVTDIHTLARFAPIIATTGVWTDGNGLRAIETYPAACKNRFTADERAGIAQMPDKPNDIADAYRCALIAHRFATAPETLDPPPADIPPSEGWIWLPFTKSGDSV